MNNQDELLWIHYICILCVPLKLNAMSLIHERVVCYFNIQSQGICVSPILGVNWYCVLSFTLRESFSEWLAVTLQLTVYDEMCVSLGKIMFLFSSAIRHIFIFIKVPINCLCVYQIFALSFWSLLFSLLKSFVLWI